MSEQHMPDQTNAPVPEPISFVRGSGNVFADLDVPDADEEFLKAELAESIRRVIEVRGLKQTDAARLLRTTQSRVSEIMGGKLEHFTYDRLFRFVRLLQVPMVLTVHESQAGRPGAGLTITIA